MHVSHRKEHKRQQSASAHGQPGHKGREYLLASGMKYILVSGGVISGLGKGVIASSIGTILCTCGLHVTSIKIDPYLNIGYFFYLHKSSLLERLYMCVRVVCNDNKPRCKSA